MRKWNPPDLPTEEKHRLAQQVDLVGPDILARKLRPWDKQLLLTSAGLLFGGFAAVLFFDGRSEAGVAIAILCAFWGFIQFPITLYNEYQNHKRFVDWLSGIQRYYGKDRAKYGN